MTARLRLLVVSPLLLIVLIASAAFPLTVRADEPPPPPAAPDVAATEAPPAETGLTESQPSTEPAQAPAPEVVAPEAVAELPPDANVSAGLPENTDLLVLDSNGEPVPLASNEAIEIIAGGDPVWCPAGQTPGDADCTSANVTFTGNGEAGLLEEMQTHVINACAGSDQAAWCSDGAGTIYIAADYDSSYEEDYYINIDSDDFGYYNDLTGEMEYYYGALTLQGGWDFAGPADQVPTSSEFNLRLEIDWDDDVTLNDLVFTGVSDPWGAPVLQVVSSGDLSLDNIVVTDNDAPGARLDTCRSEDGLTCNASGDIEVTDSQFNNNTESTDLYYNRVGLEASSGANITLTNVQASGNESHGVLLHKLGEDPGQITINGGTFNNNQLTGLYAEGNAIVVNNITASNNGQQHNSSPGAVLNNCLDDLYGGLICPETGFVTVTGGLFSHNVAGGLEVNSLGNITVSGVQALHNGWLDENGNGLPEDSELLGYNSFGAWLDNCLSDDAECAGNGSIYVSDSVFSSNYGVGLVALSSGEIALVEADASGNGLDDEGETTMRMGAVLVNSLASGNPGLTVQGGDFNNNAEAGLYAVSSGSIDVSGVEVTGNGFEGVDWWPYDFTVLGASLDNCLASPEDGLCRGVGSISVTNSVFSGNAATGLEAETFGDLTLTGVTANGNGENGVELMTDRINESGDRSTGDIVISGSTFGAAGAGNLWTGLWIDSFGNITISDSSASYNGAGSGREGEGYGMNVYTEGEGLLISLTNVVTNYNHQSGLVAGAFTAYDWDLGGELGGPPLGIVATNITANHNGQPGSFDAGAVLETDGSVWVDPSSFSYNSDEGLSLFATSGWVECSSFIGNGGAGLEAGVDDTLTVAGCSFVGNGDGDIDLWAGDLIVTSSDNCPASTGGGEDESGDLPPVPLPPTGGTATNVVENVSEGQMVDLLCTEYSGTELRLSNDDHVELPCPITGTASLHPERSDGLPGPLEAGLTYVSGMHLDLTQNGQELDDLGGTAGIHFSIPAGQQGGTFFVLHWDNGAWEKLSGTVAPDGFFEVPHAQTGIYILVSG